MYCIRNKVNEFTYFSEEQLQCWGGWIEKDHQFIVLGSHSAIARYVLVSVLYLALILL